MFQPYCFVTLKWIIRDAVNSRSRLRALYKADYLSRWIGTDFNASAKYIYNCFPMIHVICHDVIYAIAFNSFFLYIYVYIYIYIFIFIFISILIFHYSHTCILYIVHRVQCVDVRRKILLHGYT